jgi:hypothetical protein
VGQNLDALQLATLVALDVPTIQTTEIKAKEKEAVNGLHGNLIIVARINHRLTVVQQPAIRFVKPSAPTTQIFCKEEKPNDCVRGLERNLISVVLSLIMKHSLDAPQAVIQIVPFKYQEFIIILCKFSGLAV